MQRWRSRKEHRLAFKSSRPPQRSLADRSAGREGDCTAHSAEQFSDRDPHCFGRNGRRGAPTRTGLGRNAGSEPRRALGHGRESSREHRERSHRHASRLRTARQRLGLTRRRASRRKRPAQAGSGRRTTMRDTDAPVPDAFGQKTREPGVSLGHDRSSRARLRARTAGSEKARHESPSDCDEDRPLDVAPGASPSGPALLREQVPVGSAALERQRGNPPGMSASHEGGPVRNARTRKPGWLASAAGTRPREHRRSRNPQPRAGASAPVQGTEKTLTRPIRWELR
jgi:hypothetical protein